MQKPATRIFRFAPSPNGYLHLGHALSALLNFEAARDCGGRFLLRIEDIDRTRARPEFEAAIHEDLAWLGLEWERPVRRQSEHFSDYGHALERLKTRGLVYACGCSRGDIARQVAAAEARSGRTWPRDPDGAPHYPGTCRAQSVVAGGLVTWRLDMAKALAIIGPALDFEEAGEGMPRRLEAEPGLWGDVVLARKDVPTSYHLAVTVDDALQGVTDVIRGRDLLASTSVHRLLQALLGLPVPHYVHHRLVLDADGEKLAKSRASTSLRELRRAGWTPDDVRRAVSLAEMD